MTEIITKNERETKIVARLFAQELIKKPLKTKRAVIIGLEGELGSGKTRFVQGFAKGLGIRQRLTSPTFVLVKKYKLPKGRIFNFQFTISNFLYHIDCYRLSKPKDLLDLDFKEIVFNPQNIILIEWAEKIRSILPKETIWIKFEIISPRERKIVI